MKKFHEIAMNMKIDHSRNRFRHLSPPVAEFVEQDDYERLTTDFHLSFKSQGSGYSFDCMSDGTVIGLRLNELSRQSYEKALSQEWEEVEVLCHTIREILCMCGSGKAKEPQYDGRGIFLASTCSRCHKERMSGYRSEVLTSNYDCDEQIESDY